MMNKILTEDKDLLWFKDRISAYSRETRALNSVEERRIGDDILTKQERAVSYLNFFKRNVSREIRGKRILDFGSGDGLYAMEFSKDGAEVSGIDIDSALISISNEFARLKGHSASFVNYLNQRIPFADNYFDYAYCLQTFEHLDDPASSIRELCRVIKKKGLLHLSFPNRLYPFDDHAKLLITPWLPYKTADLVTMLCRRHNLRYYSNLHFHSFLAFRNILNKSGVKFSVIFKNDSPTSIKKFVKDLMNKLKIQYTIFTPNISIFLEKI